MLYWLKRLPIVLLIFVAQGIQPIWAISAQSTDDCGSFSYPEEITIPESFAGKLFTFSYSNTTNSLVISQVTQMGSTILDLPMDLDSLLQSEDVIPRRLSSNGKSMLFSPNPRKNDMKPFLVWDLETDEVVDFSLPDGYMLAWQAQDAPRWRFRDVWVDDDTLSIEIYGDRQTNLQVRQLINISTSPFAVTLGESEIFVESDWVETGEEIYGVFFSPNLTYVTLLVATPFENTVLDPATTRIFRRNSRELVYELVPTTLSRRVVGEPIWSSNEDYIIQTRTDETVSYIEALVIDVEAGFTEVTNFNAAIASALSPDGYRYLPQIRPTWSNNGNKVAIGIEGTPRTKYVAIYDFPSNTVQLFCDGGEARAETTIPFWSPDDAYFGYMESGKTYVFELATGHVHRLPDSFEFLGWVMPDELATEWFGNES